MAGQIVNVTKLVASFRTTCRIQLNGFMFIIISTHNTIQCNTTQLSTIRLAVKRQLKLHRPYTIFYIFSLHLESLIIQVVIHHSETYNEVICSIWSFLQYLYIGVFVILYFDFHLLGAQAYYFALFQWRADKDWNVTHLRLFSTLTGLVRDVTDTDS